MTKIKLHRDSRHIFAHKHIFMDAEDIVMKIFRPMSYQDLIKIKDPQPLRSMFAVIRGEIRRYFYR